MGLSYNKTAQNVRVFFLLILNTFFGLCFFIGLYYLEMMIAYNQTLKDIPNQPMYLTELATLIILTFFSLKLYKKQVQHAYQKYTLFGFISAFILMYGLLFWWFLEGTYSLSQRLQSQAYNFTANDSETYIPLFTTIFNEAEKRNVRKDIDDIYDGILRTRTATYVSESREPSYFIRLKDGKIQKLFQSGELKEETIDTKDEQFVMQVLLGNQEAFSFPQYNCCGGDDIYPDLPFFRLFLIDKRYLYDFYAEREDIYLIKNKYDTILGAKIMLHGD